MTTLLGAIFLGFGVLKFFPGVSPEEDLSIKTIGAPPSTTAPRSPSTSRPTA